MTAPVVQVIGEHPKPRGVAALIEFGHLCMGLRGVRKAGATVTSRFAGRFRDDPAEQERFLALLRG